MCPNTDILPKRVNRKPNIVVRKEENGYLLVNRETNNVLAINGTGYEVWLLLTGVHVKEVIETISKKYDIRIDECQEQVFKLVDMLLKNGFVTLG
jgi:hypothetical protein